MAEQDTIDRSSDDVVGMRNYHRSSTFMRGTIARPMPAGEKERRRTYREPSEVQVQMGLRIREQIRARRIALGLKLDDA